MIAVSFRAPLPAWTIAAEDEARFQRILRCVVGATLLASVVFSWLPRPQADLADPAEPPPRLARLQLERPPPPPTPAPALPREAAPDTPTPAPTTQARPAPAREPSAPLSAATPAAPPAATARPSLPGPAPVTVEDARQRAAGAGLLALKDQLAELRGAPVAAQLRQDIRPGAGAPAGGDAGGGAAAPGGPPSRTLSAGSGGIDTTAYARSTRGAELADRATTRVDDVPGARGGGPEGAPSKASGHKASRSVEEIRLVFASHKGAIDALYSRALREDPALQGKVVVELKIAPGGEVVGCRVVSSELKAPGLEQKLVARIRQFDFGAKNVEVMVVSWPLDFLPS